MAAKGRLGNAGCAANPACWRRKMATQHWEVELKFPLSDPAEVWARVAGLGVKFGPAVEQVDQYFNHPAREFAVTDEALRLRQVGVENCVTYKGPKIDKSTKTRQEI